MPEEVDEHELVYRYIKAIGKGILKVTAKMGISTYQSYCGAQIFDAIGLSSEFVDTYFTGTATTIEGAGLNEIAEETVRRHRDAFGDVPVLEDALDVGGDYAFRFRGEAHVWRSETVSNLQHAARGNARDKYREFARLVNDGRGPLRHHPLAVPAQDRRARTAARPSRSRKSSRRPRSSSASRPARCATARSAARRTPRSPSP